MSNLLSLFDRILKLSPFLPPEFGPMAKSITEAGTLADLIASIINAPVEEKQKMLDIADVKKRLKELTLTGQSSDGSSRTGKQDSDQGQG